MTDIIVGINEKKIIIDDNELGLCMSMFCSKNCDFYNSPMFGSSVAMCGDSAFITPGCSLYNITQQVNKFGQAMRHHQCIKDYGKEAL